MGREGLVPSRESVTETSHGDSRDSGVPSGVCISVYVKKGLGATGPHQLCVCVCVHDNNNSHPKMLTFNGHNMFDYLSQEWQVSD